MKPRYVFLYAHSRDEAYKLFDECDVLWITCCCNGVRGDCTSKGDVNAFFNKYESLDGSVADIADACDVDA